MATGSEGLENLLLPIHIALHLDGLARVCSQNQTVTIE